MADENDKHPVLRLADLLDEVCYAAYWYRNTKADWIWGYPDGFPGFARDCPYTPYVEGSAAQATALWPTVAATLDEAEKLTNGVSRVISPEIGDRVEIERAILQDLKELRGETQFLHKCPGVSDPSMHSMTTFDELRENRNRQAATRKKLESHAEKLRQTVGSKPDNPLSRAGELAKWIDRWFETVGTIDVDGTNGYATALDSAANKGVGIVSIIALLAGSGQPPPFGSSVIDPHREGPARDRLAIADLRP